LLQLVHFLLFISTFHSGKLKFVLNFSLLLFWGLLMVKQLHVTIKVIMVAVTKPNH
jgi:hypothetical protein